MAGMKKLPAFFWAIAVIWFFAVEETPGAERYMDSTRIDFFTRAQEYLFNDRFAAADSAYAAHIEREPEDPAGYLFRAAGLMADMSDREENAHSDQFHELLDQTDRLTLRILETCDDETASWMYLLRGHMQAYRSLWESRFGSFLTAVKKGFAANHEYKAGLELDSTLTDLYAGIGSYHYWKSAKAGLLRLVGVFKNEKDKGIAELRAAAARSLLHRELARSALIWIWLDKQEYDSASMLASQFVRKYPEGKTFLWPLAQALFRRGQYAEAGETYRTLRSKLVRSPGNYYNLIEVDYFITQTHNWQGEDAQARKAARRLQEYYVEIPRETLKRQKDRINFMEKIIAR